MQTPDQRIIDFINEHHVLTLATCLNNVPYCSNCFYIYLKDENVFVFTSDNDTKHAQDAVKNPSVAGSVVLETNTVGKIRGIQFNGTMFVPGNDLMKKSKKAYLKRFPMAVLMKTTLWALKPDFIKMTDNRLGFGKKLIYEVEK
jgi:uncharacterized protein YhbP (UPF0306 family)